MVCAGRVALKFLAPSAISSPEASARLLREARAASVLDHPHIGTIYEVSEADGQPFTPNTSAASSTTRHTRCRAMR